MTILSVGAFRKRRGETDAFSLFFKVGVDASTLLLASSCLADSYILPLLKCVMHNCQCEMIAVCVILWSVILRGICLGVAERLQAKK